MSAKFKYASVCIMLVGLGGCSTTQLKVPTFGQVLKAPGSFVESLAVPEHARAFNSRARFVRLDKNQNGRVEYSEYIQAAENSRTYKFRAAKADMTIAKFNTQQFLSVDVNRDGVMDAVEYRNAPTDFEFLKP